MEVILLKKEQIFSNNSSKIFDEYGTNAAITDFAILLGGFVSNHYYYNNSNLLEDRTGYYWTRTSSDAGNIYVNFVDDNGISDFNYVDERDSGVRPTLIYSSIFNICSNIVRRRDGILEVEYGEYPQKAASKELQEELESAYKYDQTSIRRTEKKYTTDSRKYSEYDEEFSAQDYEEFEYKKKRYVRVKFNSFFDRARFTLSNGEKYKNGDYVWVEVSPIKWLVDVEKDIALSERILFAGIQFDDKDEYNGNFKETFMYKYLNTIFIKDIQVQPKEIEISVIEEKSKRELELEKLEKDRQKILSLRKSLGK